MKQNKISSIIILLLIVTFIVFAGYNYLLKTQEIIKFKGDDTYSKVLFIGIDGMDYGLTKVMLDRGYLPNLKALSDEGAFLKLISSNPPQSPVAWASIATGVNPGKHNIFDFIIRNPENYLPELSITKVKRGLFSTKFENLRKYPPFWEIVSDQGIEAEIFRWVGEFPPSETKADVLPGLGVPDIRGTLGTHAYFTTKKIFNKKEEKENAVIVSISGNTIKTSIEGPAESKDDFAELPMEIEIDRDNRSVEISIGGNEKISLNTGEWSDWIPVTFNIGILEKVKGIVKFYLHKLNPEFGLYMSPINLDPSDPAFQFTNPPELSKRLYEKYGYFATIGMPEDTKALEKDYISSEGFFQLVEDIDKERMAMFWDFFRRFRSQEKAVYAYAFDASDRLQHILWEDINSKDYKVPGQMRDYLVKMDNLIGDVVKQLPEDALLLVSSDHGFTTFYRSFSLNTWLWENGYMELIHDPSDDDYGEIFSLVDWDGTKAYSVGFSGIYLNLSGREAEGTVIPSSAETLKTAIIKGLEEYIDPRTGKKVINKVYRREDIYRGEYIENAPDLIVGFMPGYRASWQSAIGGVTPRIVFPNEKSWKSDHIVDPEFVPGVFFSNSKLSAEKVNITDIAPTIIKSLGFEVPDYMDGKSLL